MIAESQHEAIEEQWFWPAVRRHLSNGDELADHAIAQEQHGKRLLQQLITGRPGQQAYHRALTEFIRAGRQHVDFEQNVVWPLFAAAVDQDESERLGRRLAVAKQVAPTRPHPGTPPQALVQKTLGTAVAVFDRVRDAATGRIRQYPPEPRR